MEMQSELFGHVEAAASIDGLRYQAEFLDGDEEAHLLNVVRSLPLHAAKYKDYVARRRVASFGGSFDYDRNVLLPGEPLDERLLPLRDRVAAWLGVQPQSLVHALVAEYSPGTPLGWHRDVPDFETVAGISLGSDATLRFRPYPPSPPNSQEVLHLNVQPAPSTNWPELRVGTGNTVFRP